MKTILVAGGAGYIGSHTIRLLLKEKYNVIVIDNLENGHKKSLPKEVKFYKVDLANKKRIEKVFSENKIDAVIHFAAYIEAGISMTDPKIFYRNNVVNSVNLFDVMLAHKVKKIIFSSTAALFGMPKKIPIKEDDLKLPVNVYGTTKLMIEQILNDYDMAYGMKNICLRYFNACGAGFNIGEDHHPESHLIPIILQVALGQRKEIKIFGNDYNTKDGTCIRDYIHVLDLARAHVLALKNLIKTNKTNYYNLGSGKGYSVKEIIEMSRKITGHKIPAKMDNRRPGDPDKLIADSTKIKKDLGWQTEHDLKSIINSAWEWHKKNPKGYND